MRRYETIVIIDPDLSDDDRSVVMDRTKDLIPQFEGFLVAEDVWGNSKLAYEIKKKARGFYIRYDYCGSGALVDEMERSFRIDDRVMKYMTVLLEKDADVEQIKAAMESAEEPTPAPEAQAPAEDGASQEQDTAEAANVKDAADEPETSEKE